jgi:hypothetical protein
LDGEIESGDRIAGCDGAFGGVGAAVCAKVPPVMMARASPDVRSIFIEISCFGVGGGG